MHRRFPRRALKFSLSPLRMPFRHARARLPDCISIIGQIRRDLYSTSITAFRVIALLKTRDEDGGTTRDSWRKSLRLQASKQQPLAMLKLLRGQESSHEHEGREPLQSQGSRRRLVSTASGKNSHWKAQRRKDLSRGV